MKMKLEDGSCRMGQVCEMGIPGIQLWMGFEKDNIVVSSIVNLL